MTDRATVHAGAITGGTVKFSAPVWGGSASFGKYEFDFDPPKWSSVKNVFTGKWHEHAHWADASHREYELDDVAAKPGGMWVAALQPVHTELDAVTHEPQPTVMGAPADTTFDSLSMEVIPGLTEQLAGFGVGVGVGDLTRPRTIERELVLGSPNTVTLLVSYSHNAGSNEARTRELVGRKIHKVWGLSDGWRGPGTVAPTAKAKEIYLAAVQVLPPRLLGHAQPTPTADGGLHLEWDRGDYGYSAEVTGEGALILNVFAPDEADDAESVVEHPSPQDLVDFVCRGA